MNRPYEKLSGKYIEYMKKCISSLSRSIDSENDFVRKTNDLTTKISEEIEARTLSPEMLKNQESRANNGWTKNFNELRQSYSLLYRKYTQLIDEEKSIHRIERKSHIRALVFRFLTTLAIGFAIMIVYFVAGVWSIQMPLLRLPV